MLAGAVTTVRVMPPRPSRVSVFAASLVSKAERLKSLPRRAAAVARSRMVPTILVILGLMFAAFVWPTRYRYDRAEFAPNYTVLVRIDRFSGETECLIYGTWR